MLLRRAPKFDRDGGAESSVTPASAPAGQDFLLFLPPFLPSSLWAAELLRGFFLPSFFALAFAFFAVPLPLPLFSAMPTSRSSTDVRVRTVRGLPYPLQAPVAGVTRGVPSAQRAEPRQSPVLHHGADVSHGDVPRRYGLIMSAAGSPEDPLAEWDPRRRAALDRIRRQFKDAGGDHINLVDELLAERHVEAAAVEILRGPEPAGE